MLKRLRPPNFALACYTLPFLVALGVGPYLMYQMGDAPWYVLAAMGIGVASVLMWCGVRPAGYVFGVALGLLALVAGAATLLGGPDWYVIARGFLYAHAAYESIAWARGASDFDSDEVTVDEFEAEPPNL